MPLIAPKKFAVDLAQKFFRKNASSNMAGSHFSLRRFRPKLGRKSPTAFLPARAHLCERVRVVLRCAAPLCRDRFRGLI